MKKILFSLSLIHFLGFSQNPKLPFKDGESIVLSYWIWYFLADVNKIFCDTRRCRNKSYCKW